MFGDTAVTVRLYDHAVPDVAADFAREVLGLDAMPVMPRAPVNTRLDADVLAFKRILNRLGMPLAEAVVASRVVGRLASSADSAALSSQAHSSRPKVEHAPGRTDPPTSRFGDGNGNGELDAASFGTAPDAAVRSGGVDLTPERAMELMLRYRAEMRRPSIRAEVLLRRCARAGLDRAPWLERGLSGVRRLLNRRRVYLEREGRL